MEQLKMHTDASFKAVYRKVLDAKARGAPNLEEYYCEMGVAANEKYHPILHDEFKLPSIVFDPQHMYFAGGVFEVEAKAFFDRLADADCNLDVDSFHEYLQTWAWPKCYATGKDVAKNGEFNAPASSYLRCAPVLAKWIESVLVPAGILPRESMLELYSRSALAGRDGREERQCHLR